MPLHRRSRAALGALLGLAFVASAGILLRPSIHAAPPETRPPDGLRDHSPEIHALTGARIVIAPGQVIESGTVVLRDGVIEAVGADVAVPPDARVWDLRGKHIYPGLIDAYSEAEIPWDDERGAGYWNEQIRPQRSAAAGWEADEDQQEELREQGIVARLVAPEGGIIKGTSALVSSGSGPAAQTLLRDEVAQHVRLTVPHDADRSDYPNSPMGAVALARQAFYDAQWYQQAQGAYQGKRRAARPEQNDALQKLAEYSHSDRLVIADTSNELFCLRADQFANEFGLRLILHGSGNEYRRLDAIRATGRPIIVPLDFPKPPDVTTPEAALTASLEDLLHWDHAPENPARLQKAGVEIAFTTYGLEEIDQFLPAVRKAVKRGLPADAALEALTRTPARWYGVVDRLGTLEPGKAAHLVVASGDLFHDKTEILETWVDGKRYEVQSYSSPDCRGTWEFTVEIEGRSHRAVMVVAGKRDDAEGTIRFTAMDANAEPKEIKLKKVGCIDSRFSCTFSGDAVGRAGIVQISWVLSAAPGADVVATGRVVWPDGTPQSIEARRTVEFDSSKEDAADESSMDDSDSSESADDQNDESSNGEDEDESEDEDDKDEDDEDDEDQSSESQPSSFAVQFPLGAFGREALPEAPKLVLITGATIWTSGPQGTLENASLLIGDGKILAVGTEVATPPGAIVIDARGKHITPGIIDCHSHMATDGGVNESGQAITAEVRIGDFIDCNDINIYRQLAGGVTTANILHGSANPIGGQNQVIKLRWGMLSEQLKFAEAPAGIKFALGENVKQSNWGDKFTTRYPQSRMGVEQIMRDEFEAARQYKQKWESWSARPDGPPPRRDLELEAIVEILDGKRWIHCHSYRQDEILALLRTLEDYSIQIGSLQHILEGYKVADEMARHGAMGSAFSDWWAYKFEVYDAIPYNGALMHEAGIVVSFNSDDRELARHLNHEAAKATKYGGVPPVEALKFVTLNPARQLRIEHLVGSLETGKHADFVIWNGPPMSTMSRCEQTWIDGRKYFDIEEDQKLREAALHMRTTLVQRILASGEKPRRKGEGREDPARFWPRDDLFCHPHHGHDEHEHVHE